MAGLKKVKNSQDRQEDEGDGVNGEYNEKGENVVEKKKSQKFERCFHGENKKLKGK